MSEPIDATAFLVDLRKLRIEMADVTHHAMQDCVREAEKAAKETKLFKDTQRTWGLAPFGPHLRNTIEGHTTGIDSGEISANTPYARFVENGTARHTIFGNPNLRFEWKGVVVFRRWVDHPGTAPRPFMERAGEYGEWVLHDSLEEYTDIAISQFNAK